LGCNLFALLRSLASCASVKSCYALPGRTAKYGVGSGQNEYEVLFKPNCKFDILEITKTNGDTLIMMEEV